MPRVVAAKQSELAGAASEDLLRAQLLRVCATLRKACALCGRAPARTLDLSVKSARELADEAARLAVALQRGAGRRRIARASQAASA